jgi:hyperosmotically inducible periplasmic protein
MKNSAKFMCLTFVLGCASPLAADPSYEKSDPRPATKAQTIPNADNTGINERDKDGAKPTPQSQSNAAEDLKILAEVRRAVVAEESFSVMAQNVKIVVENGVVTLRGPVNSEAEKAKIYSLAQSVPGVSRIENQLDIKSQ